MAALHQRPGGAAAAMRGGHFLDFNPASLAVEVFGDLARARRVAILVPGSDTSFATLNARSRMVRL